MTPHSPLNCSQFPRTLCDTPDAQAASVSQPPQLVGDGHTEQTVSWQGTSAIETIIRLK